MAARIHRPECWGPLTPTDLLQKLAAWDVWHRAEANRAGRHPTAAFAVACLELKKHYRAGRPLDPSRLPWAAQAAVGHVQTLRHW